MPWRTGRHHLDARLGLGAAWTLRHCRLVSAAPSLTAAAWCQGLRGNTAGTRRRLDSAPPPGIALTRRRRLVSALRGLGAAWVNTAGTWRRLHSALPPGLCSALTRRLRLVSALRGLGAA